MIIWRFLWIRGLFIGFPCTIEQHHLRSILVPGNFQIGREVDASERVWWLLTSDIMAQESTVFLGLQTAQNGVWSTWDIFSTSNGRYTAQR